MGALDQKYKPNQDWNHAWARGTCKSFAAIVLAVQWLTPGWDRALVQPHPSDLKEAGGKMSTPRGNVRVSWTRRKTFVLRLISRRVCAKVELPALPSFSVVHIGKRPIVAHRVSAGWLLQEDISGNVSITEH